ncbi:hypothetical protein DIPPA_15478 [Diplonema papillatum]|nr:hypothetical protein DIPPA_15478 [Diplonema papillatum]
MTWQNANHFSTVTPSNKSLPRNDNLFPLSYEGAPTASNSTLQFNDTPIVMPTSLKPRPAMPTSSSTDRRSSPVRTYATHDWERRLQLECCSD